MPGDNKTTPVQAKALNELIGLVGKSHVGGRTLCCLIGGQGSGKTWLAEHMATLGDFGQARYVSVNDIILDLLAKDPMFSEVVEFNATTITADLKRYGNTLRKAVHRGGPNLSDQFAANLRWTSSRVTPPSGTKPEGVPPLA